MSRYAAIQGSAHEWSTMTDEQIEEIMCAPETETPLIEYGLGIPRKVMLGFLEGYHCGITWPDAWEVDRYSHNGKPNPGGPFIMRMRDPKDRYQWVVDPVSAATNAAWRRGWKYGHEIKLATGRSNPMRS